MQTLGSYYSHTLLNAVLAHSARWCCHEPHTRSLLEPYDGGALFSRHARTLLFDEISQGRCNIPTVQTLLLLSAQECGAGNRTQAWLYSGIAFRLIEDMGICVDNQKYATDVQLSDEDIEIRNRLFWSCYFWDKMISIYLGRTPVLQHSTISPPQVIRESTSLSLPPSLPLPPCTSILVRVCVFLCVCVCVCVRHCEKAFLADWQSVQLMIPPRKIFGPHMDLCILWVRSIHPCRHDLHPVSSRCVACRSFSTKSCCTSTILDRKSPKHN